MAKRMTATDKWQDNCDHAGIWQVNWKLVGAHIKGKVNREAFADRVQVVGKDHWFIPGFIAFQYSTLNLSNRVHASVIKTLDKRGIDWKALSPLKEAPYVLKQELLSPLQGAKEKEKEKDSSPNLCKGEGECERKPAPPQPLSRPQQTTPVVGSARAPEPEEGNNQYDVNGRPIYRTLNKVGVACINEAKQFAAAYLKKQDLSRVIQAWDFAKPPLKAVMRALDWQLKQPDWLKTDDGAAMRWMPTPEKYLLDRMWEQPRTDGVSYTLSGAELDATGHIADPGKCIPTRAQIEERRLHPPKDPAQEAFFQSLLKKTKVNAHYAPSLEKLRAEEQIELDRSTEAARLCPPVYVAPAHPAILVRLEEKAKAAASLPVVNDLQLNLTEDKKDK